MIAAAALARQPDTTELGPVEDGREAGPGDSRLDALLDLYRRLRIRGSVPRKMLFDAFVLRPWLGNLAIVEVIAGGHDFRYRLFGTKLVAAAGQDVTGKLISQIQGPKRDAILREYRLAAQTRKAVTVRARSLVAQEEMQLERLVLPLRGGGRTIDYLLVAIYLSGRDWDSVARTEDGRAALMGSFVEREVFALD